MDGMHGLGETLKAGMRKAKKNAEQKAERAVVQGDRVRTGERSYPGRAAIDIDLAEGDRVWIQKTKNGTAIIIGA